jgi:hypothetical protein
MGALTYNVVLTIGTEQLEKYITKKHGLSQTKLSKINTNGLQAYMKKAKPHL